MDRGIGIGRRQVKPQILHCYIALDPLSLSLSKGQDYYDNIIPLLTKEGLGEVQNA